MDHYDIDVSGAIPLQRSPHQLVVNQFTISNDSRSDLSERPEAFLQL
jgi:hypothetical protein